MPHYNQYNGWGSGWFDCEPQPPICDTRGVATQEVEEKEDDCRPDPEPCDDFFGGWGQGSGKYYGGGWGSGWFDCCEPREPICNIKPAFENQFNDGGCRPEPQPCDGFGGNWGYGGWGQNGGNGHYGGFGGYTECGWAATKGWTWWNPQQDYCCEPRPDPCKDEYPEPGFDSNTIQYPGSGFDPCYDPCEVRVQDDCNVA